MSEAVEAVILSDRFTRVTEAGVDERNRISLMKTLQSMAPLLHSAGIDPNSAKGLRYTIHVNDCGQVLLSPKVYVPLP